MKDLINKIGDLKTEVNDHMDMDGDYKELIENELNGIKELVNNINYTRCCKQLSYTKENRLGQCITCGDVDCCDDFCNG